MSAILLVAHGSRDPRAAASTMDLARAVTAARRGAEVRAAFLDHTLPRPGQVLGDFEWAGYDRATVVPLLLTSAYHGRVDIPAVLAAARAGGLRLPVAVSDVLGPVGGLVEADLLAGLRRRVAELTVGFDALVLAAAGTRESAARQTVDQAAAALGAALGVPCRVGYASATAPTVGEAVAGLRAGGAERVVGAAYFLAPGRLYEAAVASARASGAVGVAAPLGAAPELVRLVLARVDAAHPAGPARRAHAHARSA